MAMLAKRWKEVDKATKARFQKMADEVTCREWNCTVLQNF